MEIQVREKGDLVYGRSGDKDLENADKRKSYAHTQTHCQHQEEKLGGLQTPCTPLSAARAPSLRLPLSVKG